MLSLSFSLWFISLSINEIITGFCREYGYKVDFEDTLFNVTLAEHWGMTILGIEDCELTLGNGIEALGSIGKELYILLNIELALGIFALRLGAPAESLIGALQQKLNIDIFAMQLNTSLAALTQINLLNIYENIVTVNVVTTALQLSNIVALDEIKHLAEARVQSGIQLLVF